MPWMIRRVRPVIVAFAILALFSYSASAGLKEGDEAFKAGHFQSAIAEYIPLAENNDANAEHHLVRAYEVISVLNHEFYRGSGGANLSQAIAWYKKAAAQGILPAKRRLAELYRIGVGVPQDTNRAAELDREATHGLIEEAARGNAQAEIDLAQVYRDGRGIERNAAQAIAWLRKAAAQGNPLALDKLALQYMRGDDLPRNPVLAYAFITLAVSGEPYFEINRTRISAMLSVSELAQGKALAADWKPGQPLPDEPADKRR